MPSFTKKAIKESFLKLLNERPLNQITVKDIVEDCGINRNSFYYHFQDLPALAEEIVKENTDRIIAEYAATSTIEECLDVAIDFALKNRRAALHLYNSASRETFEQHLSALCRHAVTEYVDTVLAGRSVDESDKALLITFFKCQLFGQIIEWLGDGMRYDLRGQFHRICELMEGSAEAAFDRCALPK